MSHNGNANKMVSDTPSTDSCLTAILDADGYVDQRNCPKLWVSHSRELERELNAANDHIKRLEEAGDALLELCEANESQLHLADQIDARCEEWRKTKEAKP